MPVDFKDIARLPVPEDNVAIAIQQIEAGTVVSFEGNEFEIKTTILVAHRFAVKPIAKGEFLLSWAQPFGTALTDIASGEYVCNVNVLKELSHRNLDFELPTAPNFTDDIPDFAFRADTFTPAEPLELYDDGNSLTFMGYPRAGERGYGTRNTIVLLGTSNMTAGFVRMMENQLQSIAADYPNIDGVVAVAHTEGGHNNPNNRALLLRTLAGFMVHPNVGAVLAVDYGTEAVNNVILRDYMVENGYKLDHVPNQFMSLTGAFQENIDAATTIIDGWLESVNSVERQPVPASELKIALQCGGSDAFSGVSGNPLASWVAKEVIRHGGAANLAETDELIGSEAYVLDIVRDLDTAQKFITTQNRFKEWMGWHGQSAEGNPSGGNILRGLYNIYLKSLGAAAKRHPDVRLDHVIDYSEPMRQPGFYFMDSPGNDLESIAGQVASGCNMIFFVTGNGSITNFPFVPTIKIITTTARYELLTNEMDVNAGEYLDGKSLDDLGQETLDLTIDVASGQLSVGEQAQHAQVQIWRDWHFTGQQTDIPLATLNFSGKSIPVKDGSDLPDVQIPMFKTANGYSSQRVNLVLPTSLCSGQIARKSVTHLNDTDLVGQAGVSHFATVVHTEGCGAVSGDELVNTLLGYLVHPFVEWATLLEHGCEKTHNGYMQTMMKQQDIDPSPFGWASVQLDGGIEKVINKMEDWFRDEMASAMPAEMVTVGLEGIRMGLVVRGGISDDLAQQLGVLVQGIVNAGGTVVVPDYLPLLQLGNPFAQTVFTKQDNQPSLGYGQRVTEPGLHIMYTTSDSWSETLTGLGAAGTEVILGLMDTPPLSSHPLVPVLQVLSNDGLADTYGADMDGVITGDASTWATDLLERVAAVLSREYSPRQNHYGNVDFQISRGLRGISF